nr:hypothetical protein [Amycolatopsis taiwanensis]
MNQLLDKYLAVANLDPGTLRGYRRNYKNHVKQLIGSKKVAEIDAQLLDSFYAELADAGSIVTERMRSITEPTSRRVRRPVQNP